MLTRLLLFLLTVIKLQFCCYKTTQRIKIEGHGYLEFINNYLFITLQDRIDKAGTHIDDHNKGVIAALSGKRKAVTRPLQSVRYKAANPFTCTACEIGFTYKQQLNDHRQTTHTSRKVLRINESKIPIIDDLSLMDVSSESSENQFMPAITCEELVVDNVNECDTCHSAFDNPQSLDTHVNNEHKSIKVLTLLRCDKCDYTADDQAEIQTHVSTTHYLITSNPSTSSPITIDEQTGTNMSLSAQELTTDSQFSCKECDFVTSLALKLKEHVQITHSSITVDVRTDSSLST